MIFALGAFCFWLPELKWDRAPGGDFVRLELGCHSTAERRAKTLQHGIVKRISERDRIGTPPAFRDLLISIASTAHGNPLRERAA